MNQTRVIDLHCDTITECLEKGKNLSGDGLHFSLDRIPQELAWCQCMALFMPDELRGEEAERYFQSMVDCFEAQCCKYEACVTRLWDETKIDEALDQGLPAFLLTVEGASALAGKLERVEHLYNVGVRMMTLTWNAANELCGGVESGEGFTPFGRAVIGEMERLGMVVDVSHLSDKGFWELCEFATKPFAASHSNARAICSHPRNLTDDMLREMVRRGGLVGLNYYDNFIKDDGGSTTVDDLLRHVHHILELGGEHVLALGSDYDGAELPPYIDGVGRITHFFEAMERSGIPSGVMHNILYGNARRLFAGEAGKR